tara:strand:- start:219 stop:1424 length:1206 start_codon:yes stop_codon:yes gene_type:complete
MRAPKKVTEAGKALEKDKYIETTGILDKETCARLSNRLFDLKKEGKLDNDMQCPLSLSIYADEVFETELERLAGLLSTTIGKKVLPTYCYARLYQKGEVLEKHSDRPSCEISITVTLDHDESSVIWPINMGEPKNLFIDKGDGVIYKGCEIPHWRDEYKGEWQTQAFFHFVDAEGEYKDHAFDKRSGLSSVKEGKAITNSGIIVSQGVMQVSIQCDDYSPDLEVSKTFFSKEECESVKDIAKKHYSEKATVGTGGAYSGQIREVNSYSIPMVPEYMWIFERIAKAIAEVNAEKYKFNLVGIIHSLELLHYSDETKCHYNWHMDSGPGTSTTRKLSVSVQLSDENDYEGGELLINNGNVLPASFEQGSINIFPSYLQHTVTEVTKGNRWAIVIWIHGTDRFK